MRGDDQGPALPEVLHRESSLPLHVASVSTPRARAVARLTTGPSSLGFQMRDPTLPPCKVEGLERGH
jgi:hypothetical protein